MRARTVLMGFVFISALVAGLLILEGGNAAVASAEQTLTMEPSPTPPELPSPSPVPPTEPAPGPTPVGNAYAPFVIDTASTPEVGPMETPGLPPPPPTEPPVTGEPPTATPEVGLTSTPGPPPPPTIPPPHPTEEPPS